MVGRDRTGEKHVVTTVLDRLTGQGRAAAPPEAASVLRAFRQGLSEAGYFAIEYCWAEGR